ncbi:hypothetical protein E4U21_001767, partial [Claviceps maximensis]
MEEENCRLRLQWQEEALSSSLYGIGCLCSQNHCRENDLMIVNGTEKWITNGTFCDYFVTGVRTGKGPEPTSPSITSKFLSRTSWDRRTKGMHVTLSNFNHGRWTMACGSIRFSRMIVEECLKWANQRLVFGKRLIDQPVIRR